MCVVRLLDVWVKFNNNTFNTLLYEKELQTKILAI